MRMITAKNAVCLLVVFFLGCGSEESNKPDSELTVAKDRWVASGIEDYRFTLKTICFCPPESDIVVIVRAGALDSAFFVDTGAALSEERMRRVLTVDGLFEEIEDAYAKNAALVRVTYNGTYGYPENLFIDYESNLADEEIRYTVTNFQVM